MARSRNLLVVTAVALFGLCSSVLAQGTLQTIKARGHIRCGASQGVAGFSLQDAQGIWVGFDVDVCRALAAAIFNDPTKAQFLPLSSKDRITALQSGEVDVLSRTMTWTLARDSAQGLMFTAVNYYDGQGFQVRKSSKVASLKELQGASICVAQGTTNELNVADYFRANNMRYEVVTFADIDDVVQAYQNGRCDALSTDMSQLASYRLKMTNPDDHVVLPDVISKEPIGPWVRQGDVQWFHIVRWTMFAMINAEELGVSQANIDQTSTSTSPEVRRLLGQEGSLGVGLGLTNDWAARIVRHVGNYGESFDRNLGNKSRIGLPRGLNNLVGKGGIQFAPPVR